MVWKAFRIGFSLLLFFVLVLQFISPASSIPIASSTSQQIAQEPPPEFIAPSASGIEKLSSDLQVLLKDQPPPTQILSIQQTEQKTLVVSAIIQPGADVRRFFLRSAVSREISGFQWVTGEIDFASLAKLASLAAVQAVYSLETYQTAEAPGLDAMRTPFPRLEVSQMRALLAQGGPEKLAQQMQVLRSEVLTLRQPVMLTTDAAPATEVNTTTAGTAPGLRTVHDVDAVYAQDLHGEGVVVAVVDTGVDFAHPDLQGTQKTISAGPYSGWPFSYDVLSGAYYAMDTRRVISPENYWDMAGMTQFVRTLPVVDPACTQTTCTANLLLLADPDLNYYLQASWPNTSQSGVYYYSIHPDVNLVYASYYLDAGYPNAWLAPPLIIVADAHQPGVYDTVFTDVNYDARMSDPAERLDQTKPQGGSDLNGDGVWDLSAGTLAWIADGVHQPPGVAAIYPQIALAAPPEAGRLVAFVTDMDGHGTNCASEIAGQGQITDPEGHGPSNPLYAGALSVGGVGGAVVQSIAPGAQIAAFQNGFSLPLDAWSLAVLGFDGLPATGDEANIVSNSWGDSRTVEDGWDPVSRFAQTLSYITAPDITFLVATGNGGHGYGTTTSPGGGPIIDVGASTAYGSLLGFENVSPDQFLSGEVQPWSNRGPGGLGDVSPDVVAVGAFAAGANPLNIYFGDGEAAYDVFGGTSLATPVAAGNLALIYQAFRRARDRWPTWQEARSILLNGAQDLGYDVMVQGAGNILASRSVAIAQELAPQVTPEQWQPGHYRQQVEPYPAFPSILHPGEQDTQQFVITNPGTAPLDVTLQSRVFTTAHEETFTINYTSPAPSTQATIPVFLENLTDLINTYQPDMVRAQVILPFTALDPDRNYYPDSWWLAAFYHWQDLNGDQNLWTDDNQDGQVNPGEIDIDSQTGLYEYNRFSSASPISTYLEASLGAQGLFYPHDGITSGIFLGLRCYFCGVSTVLQVRVTFYKQVPWDWMAFTPSVLSIPPGDSASFTAAISVPADTQPGLYEGALLLDLDGTSRVIPVAAQVAADSPTFALSPSSLPNSPYENGRMVGGFNWNWRYEAGDWQTFYYDVPDGGSQPGKSLVVDTQWSGSDTDVDTWIFGAQDDSSVPSNSAYFGPQEMQQIGGSADTYIGGGKFRWETNTGFPREIISAPLRDGLGMLTLHNVLSDGTQFAEGISGAVFTVENQPAQVDLLAQPQSAQNPRLSGEQLVTLLSTGDFDDGVTIRAYGMAAPISLTNQLVSQDIAYNICGSSWVYQKSQGGLVINQGGLLEINTRSFIPDLDLDLYLYRDNGDGIWNCSKDRLVTYSTSATASEHIKIYFPQDGRYWVAVHGFSVPQGPLPFDIDIHALYGTGVTLRNIPIGALRANQPVDFTVNIDAMYTLAQPSALEGLLLIGPPSMPSLLEVPLSIRPTVLIYPEPLLTVSSPWKQDGPRAFSLSIQNQGAQSEQVQATIVLPDGLLVDSSTASAPGEPVYDPLTRTVSWNGVIGAGEKITITVNAGDDPAAGQGPVTVQAQVSGKTSGQQWDTELLVNLNTYPVFLPLLIH